MARDAGLVLGLTTESALQQWSVIRSRVPATKGRRQGPFLAVEDTLCFALFDIVAPNAFGGSNLHAVPEQVRRLGASLRRSVTSILEKMRNLSGIRPNGQRADVDVYVALASDPVRAQSLVSLVLEAARAAGYAEDELPDLVNVRPLALRGRLLGQEELGGEELEQALRERHADRARLAEGYRIDLADTERVILATVRKGQDRFAASVMANYGHACGFCGLMDPAGATRTLLRASHIKPWSECEPRERLDVANGVAACANHDAAFDSGLLAVNGGLRIHRAPSLRGWIEAHAPATVAFGPATLRDRLALPPAGVPPGAAYLAHHCRKWGWLSTG